MKHAPFLALSVQHSYYTDERCSDFAIKPTTETWALLRNHRCVLRPSLDGLQILIPLAPEGRPLLPFIDGASLLFNLMLQNRRFALITDLTGCDVQSARRFTSVGMDHGSGELLLTDAPHRRPPRGVYAEVEVRTSDVGYSEDRYSEDLCQAEPKRRVFHVSFRAKLCRWAYYCITDLAEVNELQLINTASDSDEERLSFSEHNRRDLTEQPDPSDQIAVQLEDRYPRLRRIRFLSDQAIACRQAPRKGLELRLGNKCLLRPLPNPETGNLCQIDRQTPEATISSADTLQDSLFCVVTFLT